MENEEMNLIKQVNLCQLRTTLQTIQTATKPQLARLTGLSVITVNTLLKTLLKNGEIVRAGSVQPQVGRPAMTYRFNAEYRLALTIYTHEKRGRDVVFFSVSNLNGESLKNYELERKNIDMHSFDQDIQVLLQEYPAIRIIGFGIPATEVNGRIVSSDYPGLLHTEFCRYILEKYAIPAFIVNDVKAAIVGYCYAHHIADDRCVIGLYCPNKYPPGAAILFHGELLHGQNGLAGHIKHMPLGVDWNHVDYSKMEMAAVVTKIIKTMSCLFNPDMIVIYSEWAASNLPAAISEQCVREIEPFMLPQIIFSRELNADFRRGITRLALKQILLDQTSPAPGSVPPNMPEGIS